MPARRTAINSTRSVLARGSFILLLVATAILSSACFSSISKPSAPANTLNTSSGGTLDQQLLRAGIVEFGEHHNANAIEDFEAAYALVGATTVGRVDAEYDLGVLYAETGNIPAAETALMRALALDPVYPDALNDLAIVEAQKNPKLSISLYERLLKTNPANRSTLYTTLGDLYLRIGDRKQGQSDLAIAKALSGSPNTAPATTTTGPTGTTGAHKSSAANG